jgi:hypothetical protein
LFRSKKSLKRRSIENMSWSKCASLYSNISRSQSLSNLQQTESSESHSRRSTKFRFSFRKKKTTDSVLQLAVNKDLNKRSDLSCQRSVSSSQDSIVTSISSFVHPHEKMMTLPEEDLMAGCFEPREDSITRCFTADKVNTFPRYLNF